MPTTSRNALSVTSCSVRSGSTTSKLYLTGSVRRYCTTIWMNTYCSDRPSASRCETGSCRPACHVDDVNESPSGTGIVPVQTRQSSYSVYAPKPLHNAALRLVDTVKARGPTKQRRAARRGRKPPDDPGVEARPPPPPHPSSHQALSLPALAQSCPGRSAHRHPLVQGSLPFPGSFQAISDYAYFCN